MVTSGPKLNPDESADEFVGRTPARREEPGRTPGAEGVLLLSLFCGAGGLDLGFEQAGFEIGLAFDINEDGIASYKHNRPHAQGAHCVSVRHLTLERLDELYGGLFAPNGVIGGPPCQSFSQATHSAPDSDPRHELPLVFARVLAQLNARSPVQFFVMENVPGLASHKHSHRLDEIKRAFDGAGFNVFEYTLNARDYNTPQNRERIFLVGLNKETLPGAIWTPPAPTTADPTAVTVAAAIGGLVEPKHFERGADPSTFPVHQNHWCMQPKSAKFTTPGALVPGRGGTRSFKTLTWNEPSYTVAFGNREVHIHPGCHRRLSVYEAMRLQGFPHDYVLLGTLSSQFNQVSEAVPPSLAHAVATSVQHLLAQAAAAPAAA
jgi:DNA (cytosine-5)-methyltransferase 1